MRTIKKKKKRIGGFLFLATCCRVQYSPSEMKRSVAFMADVALENVSKTKFICPFLLVDGGGGLLLQAQSRGIFIKKDAQWKTWLFFLSCPAAVLKKRLPILTMPAKKTRKDYNSWEKHSGPVAAVQVLSGCQYKGSCEKGATSP